MVLSFLQEILDKQHSSSTIKVYAAAIAASHAPIAGRSVGRDIAVTQYLRGARRMNPPRPRTVPPWDLATVLTLFVPFQSLSLRVLSLKPALLLALASVKRVGDLQALSVNPFCLEFGPPKPRLGYVPKVLSTPFIAQVITLSASPPPFIAQVITLSAWSSWVSISDICKTAGWSLPSTFARFYNMDVPACRPEFFLLK